MVLVWGPLVVSPAGQAVHDSLLAPALYALTGQAKAAVVAVV
jgi:hypothetical protein